jgi:uncharacterized membrane protein
MTRDAAMAHLETYLVQVRRHLKGLSEAEIREVLLELRAHVLDRVEGELSPNGVEAALAALGSPREVALANVTERVAAVMEKQRGFFGVLAAVVRLAGLSIAGFVLFLASLLGYGMALAFLLVAVMKPFQPDRVGLWREGHGGFSLGVLDHPPPSADVMGFWIIPVGLVAGLALGYLTWAVDRFCIRAMVRAGRRAPAPV